VQEGVLTILLYGCCKWHMRSFFIVLFFARISVFLCRCFFGFCVFFFGRVPLLPLWRECAPPADVSLPSSHHYAWGCAATLPHLVRNRGEEREESAAASRALPPAGFLGVGGSCGGLAGLP
jgi:hypothetical protein